MGKSLPIGTIMGRIKARYQRMREERGFMLMDAISSTLIVAMAFAATFAVLDSSSRSAARDAKRSQALILAQNELNRMRNIGQKNQDQLLNMNETTNSVVYRGQNFLVTYTAFPTTGIGEGGVGACSAAYGSVSESSTMPDNQAFVYMRVDVTPDSGPTGSTGATSASKVGSVHLDSWFAAERGSQVTTNVGMMRVYALGRDGTPSSGVSSVTLRFNSIAPDIQPVASDSTNGCFLFANLQAGEYQIRVGTALQDVYMSNTGSMVTSSYTMPTGVLRSTAVRLSSPIKVTPAYRYVNGTDQNLNLTNANVNRFVKGVEGTGNWFAMSDVITKPQNANHFTAPGGVMMPNNLSGDVDKSKMYPAANGYKGYAGVCHSNNPGEVNWASAPTTMPNATWVPGGTLSPDPILWLSLLRPTSAVGAAPGAPGTPGAAIWENGNTRWVNWGHYFTSAKVQVALSGGPDGSNVIGSCRTGYSYTHATQKWVRLPGTISTNGGGLTDIAGALPPGRYDMCMQFTGGYRRQVQKVVSTGFLAWGWRYQGSPEDVAFTGGRLSTGKILGYRAGPLAAPETFTADGERYSYTSFMQNATSNCGDPAKWTG